MMEPASRTPEGKPNRYPLCGHEVRIEPSIPPGDAPCPNCGHLLWFDAQAWTESLMPHVPTVVLLDLQVRNKEAAIAALVDALIEAGLVVSATRNEIIATLLARERRCTTAIGGGIAIPHACHATIQSPVLAVGYSAKGVDFASLDGRPVQRVILLLCPDGQPGASLQALEKISRGIRKWRGE
jgi:PTS system nitrogen regulatory IIA component